LFVAALVGSSELGEKIERLRNRVILSGLSKDDPDILVCRRGAFSDEWQCPSYYRQSIRMRIKNPL
jgi:hypothetical protein